MYEKDNIIGYIIVYQLEVIMESLLDVRNYMENIVLHQLDNIIEKVNACNCQACRSDVFAITLNNLPPKYIVTEKGHLYSKLSVLQQQFEVDVITELVKAIKIVSSNPRHEEYGIYPEGK